MIVVIFIAITPVSSLYFCILEVLATFAYV